jgi:hypothetical protein
MREPELPLLNFNWKGSEVKRPLQKRKEKEEFPEFLFTRRESGDNDNGNDGTTLSNSSGASNRGRKIGSSVKSSKERTQGILLRGDEEEGSRSIGQSKRKEEEQQPSPIEIEESLQKGIRESPDIKQTYVAPRRRSLRYNTRSLQDMHPYVKQYKFYC